MRVDTVLLLAQAHIRKREQLVNQFALIIQGIVDLLHHIQELHGCHFVLSGIDELIGIPELEINTLHGISLLVHFIL